MAVDIVMPQMGESIFEGTITKWLKKPGDKVERDEPLFEISTDKVDAEIPSPSAGVLKEIKVDEGKTVPIQTVVGVIDARGRRQPRPAPAAAAKAGSTEGRGSGAAKAATASSPRPATPARRSTPRSPRPAPQRAAQPARKMARAFTARRWCAAWPRNMASISERLTGTGAGGRISKQDIEALSPEAVQQPAPHAPRAAHVRRGVGGRATRSRLRSAGTTFRLATHRALLRLVRPRRLRQSPADKCTCPSNPPCPAKKFISATTKCNP